MAGYNKMNRGYYANDRNKASYGGSEYSEGRKRPIIAYTPNHSSESYVATRTAERVVEHVLAPVAVTEYKYISQAKVEPMRDYGVTTEEWRRPLSPVGERQQVVVTKYRYGSSTEPEPVRNYGVTQDKWRRSSSPVPDRPQVVVTEYGYSSPTKAQPGKDPRVTLRDRSPEVEEFITKVQTEASRPIRPGVLSAKNWRNMSNPAGQGSNTGYGEYTNNNNSDNWDKPGGKTVWEPTPTNKEGWERPSHVTPLSQAAKVEPIRDNGVTTDKWPWPLSPVRDRPQVVVTEYGYGSPIAEVEPVKNYGSTGDKWRRPSSPVRDRPQAVVTEYGYVSPITEVEPVKNYGSTGDKWRRPSSPVRDRPQVMVTEYEYGSPTKVEPVKDAKVTARDRPPEVEEFTTKDQIGATRPTRPGILSATNWRKLPYSAGQGGSTGYGEYTNYNNSDNWNKSNGNTTLEPTITNKEGWERPSRNTPLSGPTNDIGKAVDMLKEAVKPSPVIAAASPQPWYTVPASTFPKRDTYTEVIDRREAPRSFNNLNLSSRPFQTGETYTGTIDSNEAARKYKGTMIK